MKDGWHVIKGYEVYVENDCIIRGIIGSMTSYPYRYNSKTQCMDNVTGVKVSTFAKSDLYKMK